MKNFTNSGSNKKSDGGFAFEESEISYYTQELTSTFSRFFLDEEIKDARYYRPLVQHLLSASDRDVIEIVLATGGGSLNGCMQVIEALKSTDARTVGIIMGECHSAGSIISMYTNEVVVLDSATMLVHSASYGTGMQKSRDVKDYVEFSTRNLEQIFKKAYEGFLSDEEMLEVLNGRELWLDADEIDIRMLKRSEHYKQKALKVDEECAGCKEEISCDNSCDGLLEDYTNEDIAAEVQSWFEGFSENQPLEKPKKSTRSKSTKTQNKS